MFKIKKIVSLTSNNEMWILYGDSLLRRGSKGFFSGGVDLLSNNVSAGTELQATANGAGASARYHTRRWPPSGRDNFLCTTPWGGWNTLCHGKDGGQDFEVQRCLRFS